MEDLEKLQEETREKRIDFFSNVDVNRKGLEDSQDNSSSNSAASSPDVESRPGQPTISIEEIDNDDSDSSSLNNSLELPKKTQQGSLFQSRNSSLPSSPLSSNPPIIRSDDLDWYGQNPTSSPVTSSSASESSIVNSPATKSQEIKEDKEKEVTDREILEKHNQIRAEYFSDWKIVLSAVVILIILLVYPFYYFWTRKNEEDSE